MSVCDIESRDRVLEEESRTVTLNFIHLHDQCDQVSAICRNPVVVEDLHCSWSSRGKDVRMDMAR